ncbi:class I SAM-dependent methyltransferase [Patescibacteria group bacterium]|nr:class I SAM-dependent methyltransferase [Patescibacteria group bacterium]
MTLFRKLTNKLLKNIELNGEVLDLGGGKDAGYVKLFKGNFCITGADIDSNRRPDIVLDFESMPLPVTDNKYDAVLLINVLEHIFNFEKLLKESFRIIKKGGKMILVVPFLHQIHPSPSDYFRYTNSALFETLKQAGFNKITVIEIGSGVFGAVYNLSYRFIPFFLEFIIENICVLLDKIILFISRKMKKAYRVQDYPLGYLVRAEKF